MINRVLVYGGCGALGRSVVSRFKKESWCVISVDFRENNEAAHNIQISQTASLKETGDHVLRSVEGIGMLNAVFNVAGGWSGGNALAEDFLSNVQLMILQSVYSTAISAKVAAHHLQPGGVFSIVGAASAMDPTPQMIAYGSAKASAHHIIRSLAENGSGLASGCYYRITFKCSGDDLCSITLDTPMNRQWMPNADFSSWTPLSEISDLFFSWAQSEKRPATGSLIKVITTNGNTIFENI